MRKLKSEKLVICPRSNTKFIVFQKTMAIIKGIYEKLYEKLLYHHYHKRNQTVLIMCTLVSSERSLGLAPMHIKCIWNDMMEIIQIMDSKFL